MASPDDINSTLKGIVTNIANEVTAVQALGTTLAAVATTIGTSGSNTVIALNAIATAILDVFPRISGTFTLSNATVTVVSQVGIKTGGFPLWTATNATAALTVRTAGLYLAAVTAGTGFSLSTQVGSAVGTESFSYIVYNP